LVFDGRAEENQQTNGRYASRNPGADLK
jgi:hypothetical protein